MSEYKVNGKRLINNLMDMAQYGVNSLGGIDRELGSKADEDVRKLLINYWKKVIGIDVCVDPAANIWGSYHNSQKFKPIVIGSHHDAVPDGGKYDGAMGVAIATEVMETIVENKIQLKHPIKIISFTGEEPNPFALSTLGSKVISGRLNKEKLRGISHRYTNEGIGECINRLGGDFEHLDHARIYPGNIAGFIEVHNELGRYLESQNAAVSAVNTITGIYRESIKVEGETNHAGTTMMPDRKDAFLAMAELALAIENEAKRLDNPYVVGTMGYVKVIPNEASIISGITESIVDIRTSEDEKKNSILKAMNKAQKEIESRRQVKFERKVILDQPRRDMDTDIVDIVREEITKLGEKNLTTVSMAGHDAANMQLVTKSGMIFVKSVAGRGHCRQEYSEPEDIIKGAQVALNVILRLDEELEL